MSQDYTVDVYAQGHVADTDLGNMEKNFECLISCFSGAAQPGTMAACHPWFDTTKHVLKVRNDGDSTWLGLMHGDVSQKMWIYRNAAMNGWAIDAGVSDRVLALKGGAVYTTGGAGAGTWTQPNHTHTGPNHNHLWYVKKADAVNDQGYDSSGVLIDFGSAGPKDAGAICVTSYADYWGPGENMGTSLGGTANTGGKATLNTYRPAASVGTLQYLDL